MMSKSFDIIIPSRLSYKIIFFSVSRQAKSYDKHITVAFRTRDKQIESDGALRSCTPNAVERFPGRFTFNNGIWIRVFKAKLVADLTKNCDKQ